MAQAQTPRERRDQFVARLASDWINGAIARVSIYAERIVFEARDARDLGFLRRAGEAVCARVTETNCCLEIDFSEPVAPEPQDAQGSIHDDEQGLAYFDRFIAGDRP